MNQIKISNQLIQMCYHVNYTYESKGKVVGNFNYGLQIWWAIPVEDS
jgi:hypothetical protein